MKKQVRYFVGDFETTVYQGQERTDVWASALVELGSEDVHIFHNIDDTFKYLYKLRTNLIVYYHNLKFDGSFWLDYFLIQKKMQQANFAKYNEDGSIKSVEWYKDKDMAGNTIKYQISHMGQWYSIKIKKYGHIIEIRDSLKLLPFSVKKIGSSFGTRHHKLEMEYEGYRYPGCYISPEEKKYIANDVLVVKEALEIMFKDGHSKMTIGACCLDEYKKSEILPGLTYEEIFEDLSEIKTPDWCEQPNADSYVRKSYYGGWCYLVPEKANKEFGKGSTADVNSLYSSQMSSESGNYYPVGFPHFWKGSEIPELAKKNFWFIHFKCKFRIKEGFLPFIHIRGNPFYKPNENLTTSDFYDPKTKRYYEKGWKDGVLVDSNVELTLTMMDFELFKKHYHIKDLEILDGVWFYKEIGIFDSYINKYKKIKMKSKGAVREEAKLFLNNLYGKMAASTNSSFKVAEVIENELKFQTVHDESKKPGYIAVGSAITSYCRCFTITAAQKNYHGPNKPGFIYADTDSIHCDMPAEELKGIKIHDTNFNCWKIESEWEKAIFVRQKTYIEIENGKFNVKCAGMPPFCKDLFIRSVSREYDEEFMKRLAKPELEFVLQTRTLKDFKVGLKVPGKLIPKRIPGGVLLVKTHFEIR